MKAMVVSPVGGRVPPSRGVLHNGLGINGTRRDLEAEEVAAYLTKLRSLVPDMPRKRKLSKLEVIQRVIEYICDLQSTLEETNVQESTGTSKSSSRQPLQPLLNVAATTVTIGSVTGSPSTVVNNPGTPGSTVNSNNTDSITSRNTKETMATSMRAMPMATSTPTASASTAGSSRSTLVER
ncbi:DNA-binding protein inhibitor ID-2 [Cephus cinctus]|uniref:DNA-binding protein inhibitor ID-2 n=1 Tax=Cephus cinctus TaxID=211228 RepID=A0AAJ7CGG5_CEPCN|nr:DNA-binding protein inhibitor ID-2 [Cephus cinctus]